LQLTAMAANPLGTEIARGMGVDIGFGLWLLVAGEEIVIRSTGCPNGCARPYMAEIAFVGKAPVSPHSHSIPQVHG